MSKSLDRFLSSIGLMLGVLVSAGSLPISASAQESGGTPIYVGIGADFGFEDFDNVPSGIDIDEAYGFNGWAGYRFSDLFAAELSLEYLNGFDFSFLGFEIDGQALASTVNAKIFPLARVVPERIEPFLYTGIGVAWAEYDTGFGDTDETGFAARFGGGFDLYVTDNLALQASSSYVLPTGDLKDFSYVSLVFGIQYRFGRPPRS